MAVGLPLKTTYANGDVYSASDVNDTNGTINANASPYAAGKNIIINGDLRINQRNFTSNTTNASYNFDRFSQLNSGGTVTVTPQTFTAGAAPVAGYEAINFVRMVTASQSAAGDFAIMRYMDEDVRTFANETVTISFWAKAASGTPKMTVESDQIFGIAGSSAVQTTFGTVTLSTSWTRYTLTATIPSISGKTIGTSGSSLAFYWWVSAGTTYAARTNSMGVQNGTFDLWGFQVEAGSTATPFQTASGTIGGELALCQRYYWRAGYDNSNQRFGTGAWNNPIPNRALVFMTNPVVMRTAPSSTIDYANIGVFDNNSTFAVTSLTMDAAGAYGSNLNCYTASGSVAYRPVQLVANGSTSAYIGFSAEL
jgi:hypothetical protein